MASINDYGAVNDKLDDPPFGGPNGWAAAVALALGNSDTPVDTRYLNLAGGTLTGPIVLSGDPTAPLEASTRRYVDTRRAGLNRIINGDFSVNQRGFSSGSALGVNLYGFDLWRASGWGGTCTYSAQTPAPGEIGEASRYARVVTSGQSAADHWAMLFQSVEDVRTLQGKQVTLSFWAKAASGTPSVALEIQQNFGSGGSAVVFTAFGKVAITTTWARYSITGTLPSIAGKTVGTNNALQVDLWTSAGSNFAARASSIGVQNNTIDIWGVQLEEGNTATPFEQLPVQQQLDLCQRYFWRLKANSQAGFIPGGTSWDTANHYLVIPMKVPMRAIPSFSCSAGNTFHLHGGSAAIIATSVNPGLSASTDAYEVTFASAAFNTVGASFWVRAVNGQTAYMDFNAEL